MIRIDAQIRFVEQCVQHGEAGLPVAFGVGELPRFVRRFPRRREALRGDRGGELSTGSKSLKGSAGRSR